MTPAHRPRRRALRALRALVLGCAAAVAVLSIVAAAPAHAADACPGNADALGVSRTLEIDTRGGLFVGTKSYPDTLPLANHEIVLTFDDGPSGKNTDRVLEALAHECVKATFFAVGDMAAAHPDQLKRMAAAGHTIGTHSMTHVIMTTVPGDKARADIEAGWRTVDRILTDGARTEPPPFFRFPGFAPTAELSQWLKAKNVGVFGADFWGSDWNPMTGDQILAQVLGRIEARGSGILLLHDIHAHTADMVPALLKELKRRGWKVVHIVPKPA